MKAFIFTILGFLMSGTYALALTGTQPPIKITSCVVARDNSQANATGGVAFTNGVTAVIVNTSTKEIKDAQFSGIYNGATVTDTIPGPFEPGQTYTLHKAHKQFVYQGPDASCVLNHVTFADGTAWTMAQPPVMKH